jgi:hypothetical protein
MTFNRLPFRIVGVLPNIKTGKEMITDISIVAQKQCNVLFHTSALPWNFSFSSETWNPAALVN